MALVIHNTQSRKKETFTPLSPGEVKMYVCGPTVYDFLHIGNYRGPIFFNVVRNWLERSGYKVTYVYNYTDVDDKIINRANSEGVSSESIAEKYIQEFETDFKALGLTPHTHNPRVTHFIEPIIEIIQKLIERGAAYVVNGEVLYSIKSFDGYGKLSGKSIDDLISGARVEIDAKKENPLDFTLWKPSKPGEPKWPSPWGDGRPGWHIECSAMSSELLGESFDIHGGGIDLIFPHHENEIAQSEGASHKPFVRYWMHNNFINFGAHKMSKSLGNIMTGRAFMAKYNPEILKYMILLAHYRSPVDFSQDQINHAVHGLARIYSALCRAHKVFINGSGQTIADGARPGAMDTALKTAQAGVSQALDDDFNTPEVFARLFELVRLFNSSYRIGQKITPDLVRMAHQFTQFILETGRLMALFQEPAEKFLLVLDDMLLAQKNLKRDEIDQMIRERTEARSSKNFSKSDELRDKLNILGIAIQDTPEGTQWEVQK